MLPVVPQHQFLGVGMEVYLLTLTTRIKIQKLCD